MLFFSCGFFKKFLNRKDSNLIARRHLEHSYAEENEPQKTVVFLLISFNNIADRKQLEADTVRNKISYWQSLSNSSVMNSDAACHGGKFQKMS